LRLKRDHVVVQIQKSLVGMNAQWMRESDPEFQADVDRIDMNYDMVNRIL
jgi:hypothetical protein